MTNSMTCAEFETVLPELLDDDSSVSSIPASARMHLSTCDICRALFQDLGALRAAVAVLPPLEPAHDLWAGIAARIEAPVVPLLEGGRTANRPRQLTWRTAGLAAAALVIITTGVTFELVRRFDTIRPGRPVAAAPVAATESSPVVVTPSAGRERMTTASAPSAAVVLATSAARAERPREDQAVKSGYDREIAQLRKLVDSSRSRLDPATVAILEQNLHVIDAAIEQCNDALRRDSSSAFLLESLDKAYRTKVKLLRVAASAASDG